ncbi:acyltransferase family protein [Aurantimonas aggregata]|uniref:Acyltransferase family protein n=1 Tax=Aurantimonas aggregata TaxID=2047720 RepID=A0A6L9MEU2_9HYPH|nr:acyltransferase [Aurantimonas aggregata]NDV86151.1 acyltransferase family protein [Aurantimonas aggregata]
MQDERGGFEGQLRPTASRFQALDGLRGICALLVVVFHAPVSGAVYESSFFRHGFLFVDFFFVLSGFVIAHAFHDSLAQKRNGFDFLRGRLFRVYPLHLFMLALFVGFELFLYVTRGPGEAFQGGNGPVALVHNLLMTHSFGVLDTMGWNYPSWSISAELLAYGFFALVVVTVPRALLPLMVLCIVSGIVVIGAAEGTIDTTVGYGWLRCLMGFSLGVIVRLVLWPRTDTAVPTDQGLVWTLAELAAVVMVAVFVTALGGTSLSLAAPFVFAFALYVFAHEGGLVSRLLRSKPATYLGLVSYSVYLTHAFVISRVENVATVVAGKTGWAIFSTGIDGKRLLGATEGQALLALGLIVMGTLVASALTWRFVERPGMALGRRLRERQARTARVGRTLAGGGSLSAAD